MAVRGYAQKLDQYGTDYTSERRMYGEHSTNLGRRDGLTDLDRRYPDHIPAGHQVYHICSLLFWPFSLYLFDKLICMTNFFYHRFMTVWSR
jgi:hypothetical protein